MICKACGKKEATFHYTLNENGNITETHLCHECAKKSGLMKDSHQIFTPYSLSDNFLETEEAMLGELLGGLFSKEPEKAIKQASVCPFCGMRLSEFMHGGKAGCAKCYTTFGDSLAPTLKKLHGNTKHTGLVPGGREIHKTKEDKRKELETLLNKAIQLQEYEKAAEYRDMIRDLDKNER